MKLLRLTLAAQLVFFAAWAARLLAAHRGSTEVWLETMPVDPRDLLSGHYVALDYAVGAPSGPGCERALADGAASVHVRLEPTGRSLRTLSGPVDLWGAVECSTGSPRSTGVWARGRLAPRRRGAPRLSYGIERYYVGERDPLRWAASGGVVARVSVNARREARILELVRLDQSR